VAQDAIRANTKDGGTRPAIIVRRGAKPTRHNEVQITAPDGTVVGTFHYSPHKPLSCGARVWLELAEGFNAEPASV
jgi:hypothetical protein